MVVHTEICLLFYNRKSYMCNLKRVSYVDVCFIFQECYDLIKKAQTQQKVLLSKYNNTTSNPPEPTAVPPPPILVYRNSSTIILKPAPYKPLSNEKVGKRILIKLF